MGKSRFELVERIVKSMEAAGKEVRADDVLKIIKNAKPSTTRNEVAAFLRQLEEKREKEIEKERRVIEYLAKTVFPEKDKATHLEEVKIVNVARRLNIPESEVKKIFRKHGWKSPVKANYIRGYLEMLKKGGKFRTIAPPATDVVRALKGFDIIYQDVHDYYQRHSIRYKKVNRARKRRPMK